MRLFLRLQHKGRRLQLRPGLQLRRGLRLHCGSHRLLPLRPMRRRRQGRDNPALAPSKGLDMTGGNVLSIIDTQLAAAAAAARLGDWETEFRYLERAHILAQASTCQHVRIHWRMLRWATRRRDWAEFLGQIPRISGAAVLTVFGLVPKGNTGGTNVSAFRAFPIPADLAALMSQTVRR